MEGEGNGGVAVKLYSGVWREMLKEKRAYTDFHAEKKDRSQYRWTNGLKQDGFSRLCSPWKGMMAKST